MNKDGCPAGVPRRGCGPGGPPIRARVAAARAAGEKMIALTRLNGQQFVVNAERIRYVESTPDTVVCCDSGDRIMVREPLSEVMRRAIDYARVIRRAVTE